MLRLPSRLLIVLVHALFVLTRPALADSTVVFNEIMYHPASNEPALEWLELHNQMAVNMDLSGWSLDGGVQFRFAEGTVVPGDGYLVVAVAPAVLAAATGYTNAQGPFIGRLSNSGERLELRNNNHRLMDWVEYGTDGDWPVGPDGGGVSLAKINPNASSAPATNWSMSARIGGTPGAPNFPRPGATATNAVLVRITDSWKYQNSGTDPGVAWRGTNFDDSAWQTGQALFYAGNAQPPAGEVQPIPTLFNTGVDANHSALTPGVADPHYLLTVSAQSTPPPPPLAATVIQNHPAWLANDALSSWVGPVNPGTANVAAGEYRYRTTFDLTGFSPGTAQVVLNVAADNRLNNVLLNGASTGIAFVGFSGFSPNFTLSAGFVAGTNSLEFYTANDTTTPNPAGFRANLSGAAQAVLPRNTLVNPLPLTTCFRKTFLFREDPASTVLTLHPLVDDGAVFYLNGVELSRVNMPGGAIAFSTPAALDVTNNTWGGLSPIPASSLAIGTNVLAVEVHQSTTGANDLLFAAELLASPGTAPPVSVAFNEIAAATNASFWLELANSGTNEVPLNGYVLVRDGALDNQFVFPAGDTIGPGGFLSMDEIQLGFHPQAGDKLYLYPPNRSSIIDAVVVKNASRGRHPDATGRWLYPAQPTPGGSNLFSFQREIIINEIMYHHRALTNAESPEAWVELFNRGTQTMDLTGWRLDKGIDFAFPAGTTLAPGSYLIVTGDTNYLRSAYPNLPIVGNFTNRLSHHSDLIALIDSSNNPADEVRYYDDGRWSSYADGGGSSLELRNPFGDNAQAEAWAASDESTNASWKNYTYRGLAAADGGPTRWNEFVLGLLDKGEVLLDDISVIESPASAPRELLQNGSFENGATAWRIIGNHHGEVIAEPDNPANHVLHLIARGPTEHMHNHAETTLANSATVVNGREYQISFRAKWLAGANQLHTRLYFNRVAQVTLLDVPQSNGTPGARNSRYQTNIGPTFADFRHSPVVPQANEPVTVSVTADDPDSVAACVLWWSVNGGAWTSVPMTPTGASRFQGTVPAYASASVIQFYVEATDGLGAKATFPAAGRNSRALYKVNDGQAIPGRLHNLRLIMTSGDAAVLHSVTNVMSNGQMGATVVYDEQEVFYDVGVHLQSSERGRADAARVGFTIEFLPDQLFRGVHDSITVDRSGGYSGIGGDQDEIVLKHAINHAGGLPGMYDDLVRFIAPLNQHTGPGLLLMAKYGDEFLDSQYVNGSDGREFKLELIYYPQSTVDGNVQSLKLPQPDDVIGTDIQNRGNGEEPYRWNFLIENNRDQDDYLPLINLAKAFSLSGSALDAQTQQLMDVDEWMRAFAMKTLSGDIDTYSQGYPHNFIIYFRPEDGRALAFLWDMDFSWTRAVSAPLIGSDNIGKIISLPNNRRLFYAHLNDLITTTFNTTYMAPWTAHYASLVSQNFSGVLNYIGQRASYVRSQFPAQIPFAITTNGGQDFMVNTTSAPLAGTGWLNVRRIVIEGRPDPVPFIWSGLTTWQGNVPLILGTNRLNLLAYDFQGNLVASNAIVVTSTAVGGGLDGDGDGLPDIWEAANGLNSSFNEAALDYDGDGLTNLQEYLAGTNPLDASSQLNLQALSSTGGIRLKFQAVAGRSYRIQYSELLPGNSWNTLTNLAPQIRDNTVEVPETWPAGAPGRFYRLATP